MAIKSIEQIKEEYAHEARFGDWDVLVSFGEDMHKHIDQVIKRYAQQFQAPTKDLEDWKESSLQVMNELNLQAISDELGLKLGSSIAPQVLPEISVLRDRVQEMEERIQMYKECFEEFITTDKWDEATVFLSTYGSGLAKDLNKKELINKSK